MTKIIHRTGDIFTTLSMAIGQGVNVDGVMGSGIAAQFQEKFPTMYWDYKNSCAQNRLLPGGIHVWEETNPSNGQMGYIYNIASQDRPGPNAQYQWLRSGVTASLRDIESRGGSVLALPRIASGLGGLEQAAVEELLTELAVASAVDIELWTYNS